ncbi:unnamed protein product [Heligmosomoides polygyrus]|uniref:Spindle and centriole-associated protein 1 n=1 Tax=Heligmosomoides polygyrus TaxID=6339 RepID=A0A3P7ZHV6_HELPZ|nr:unnamed protein product [Heligmosomoides polygyrus]
MQLSTVTDVKILSAIQTMLRLLQEAEVIKENLSHKCRKMKEEFDRDEAAVRTILAESNIPTAISDSLLDSHFKFTSKKLAGAEEAPAPAAVQSPMGNEMVAQG